MVEAYARVLRFYCAFKTTWLFVFISICVIEQVDTDIRFIGLVKMSGNSLRNPGKLVFRLLVNTNSDAPTLPFIVYVVATFLCAAS